MAKRKQYCGWCGTPLGEYDAMGEPQSCGEPECNEAAAEAYREEEERRREEEERRREAAERDNYERY